MIRDGFCVGNKGAPIRRSLLNMSSAREKPEVIREYLAKECSEGRVLGLLDPSYFPFVHTSRFGVIPKGTSGKWRLIVNMSAPQGASINDLVSESVCSLSYVSVDDTADGIVRLGMGALLAKIDIKSAYRNVPIHPDDRWLMGMYWDDAPYVDTALPFGLRSALKIFLRQSGYDPSCHLSYGDVRVDNTQAPSFIEVHIKASKTDPFRKGVSVFLGRVNGELVQ